MFEVFVARARSVQSPGDCAEWDRLELGEFVVANAFVLRRREWIEAAPKISNQFVGQHPVEQRFGTVDSGSEHIQSVIVELGLSFTNTLGAELSLDADTFPQVLQLRYEVRLSRLPQSSRIAVGEHRCST